MSQHARDLYGILELDSDCDAAAIKSAYHRLARIHHPDKSQGDHTKFQDIQHAYEILSDEQRRSQYDRTRFSHSDDPFSPEDTFYDMFSQPRQAPRKPPQAPPSIIDYSVTLQEVFTGADKEIELERSVLCSHCKGKGHKANVHPTDCKSCGGQGKQTGKEALAPGLYRRVERTCFACSGTGKYVKSQERCSKCKGSRIRKEKKKLPVHIEKAMETGDKLVYPGESDHTDPEQKAGDLHLRISILPHSVFQTIPSTQANQAPSLVATTSLNLTEALYGFDRSLLRHLDGRNIRIKSPPPNKRGHRLYQRGDILKVKGEGMPSRRGIAGDLYMKIEIEMPTSEWLAMNDLSMSLPHKRVEIGEEDFDEYHAEFVPEIPKGRAHSRPRNYDEEYARDVPECQQQ